jgi:hypothetical protein
MKIYTASYSIEWELTDNIMIADSYEKAVQALVDYLNDDIHMVDANGIDNSDGEYRYYFGYVDHLEVVEHELNTYMGRDASRSMLEVHDTEIQKFVHSPEFHQGQGFTAEMLESWNKVLDSEQTV